MIGDAEGPKWVKILKSRMLVMVEIAAETAEQTRAAPSVCVCTHKHVCESVFVEVGGAWRTGEEICFSFGCLTPPRTTLQPHSLHAFPGPFGQKEGGDVRWVYFGGVLDRLRDRPQALLSNSSTTERAWVGGVGNRGRLGPKGALLPSLWLAEAEPVCLESVDKLHWCVMSVVPLRGS